MMERMVEYLERSDDDARVLWLVVAAVCVFAVFYVGWQVVRSDPTTGFPTDREAVEVVAERCNLDVSDGDVIDTAADEEFAATTYYVDFGGDEPGRAVWYKGDWETVICS